MSSALSGRTLLCILIVSARVWCKNICVCANARPVCANWCARALCSSSDCRIRSTKVDTFARWQPTSSWALMSFLGPNHLHPKGEYRHFTGMYSQDAWCFLTFRSAILALQLGNGQGTISAKSIVLRSSSSLFMSPSRNGVRQHGQRPSAASGLTSPPFLSPMVRATERRRFAQERQKRASQHGRRVGSSITS